jgi:hypothetical protein
MINDTLNILVKDTISQFKLVLEKDENNWQIYFLILGVISVFVAVFIPFLQKKYEHQKSKNSFKRYVKYYLGEVVSILIKDKIYYGSLENSSRPKLLNIEFKDAVDKYFDELMKNKDTISSTLKYQLIFNLQSIFIKVYQFTYALKSLNLESIKEKTLAFGDKLSKKDLNSIYSFIATIEHLGSITIFNDIFGKLKSVERILNKDNLWVGIKTEKTFLNNQECLLNSEFSFLLENKEKIKEILLMVSLTIVQIEVFYDTFKGKLVDISESQSFKHLFNEK